MAVSAREPGLIVSGGVHAALLLATLVAFSDGRKFDDAQETVPVEIVTDQQFNQIMKGEKTAKQTQPRPRVEKEADKAETKPLPPLAEAKKDVPVPPPPLKRLPDPGEDDKPETPTPPEKVAALPPPPPPRPADPTPPAPQPQPRPEALKQPAPTKAEEKPEPEDAETIDKKPPPRPKEAKPKEEPTPTPPTPPARPKEPPKPKFDEMAKLLEQKKLEDMAKAEAARTAKPEAKPTPSPKPPSRPRSGEESDDKPSRFDPSAIARELSKEAPQRAASTGRERSQTASLGSPTASASRMSPSMWGQLDGLLQEQYKRCWSYFGTGGARYVPQIKVAYAQDGSLIGAPSLINPPSDPNLQSLAESALRAVRRCNPLRIPSQYAPYYDQWKARIVRFDPEEMT